MSTWMQIKFDDVEWFSEKLNKSRSLETEPVQKMNAMSLGFLKSKIEPLSAPVSELLARLIKTSNITLVTTIGRSKFLGPGTKRCSIVLPKSIIIPTDIALPMGVTKIPLINQEIKVSDERYHMTMGLTVRSAAMSASDADVLYGVRPREFIGYIDSRDIPEGTVSKASTSGSDIKVKHT